MTRTLLAVLAHPDDETFGTGGTLALYARQRGVDVYLVCGTRGEVGEMDPKYMRGFNTIAERREAELRCAAENLGLKGVFFLNYRDSGMPGSEDNRHPQALAFQPVEKVAAEIAHYIRQLRPQVVITFDPIGGYRHPDHIAIHNATVEAFRLSGDPGQAIDALPPFLPSKLYFSTFSRRFLRTSLRVLKLLRQDPEHFGKNRDINLASLVDVDYPIHATIPIREVESVKERAMTCHSSQGGSLPGPLRWVQRLFVADE